MKANMKKILTGTLVTALPLLIAVGCTGNSHNIKLTETDDATTEAAYVAEIESEPELGLALQYEDAAVEETTDLAIANMDGYMAQVETYSVDEVAVDEIATTDSEEMADELAIQETVVDMITAAYEAEAKTVLPPPQKMVFHFASGKNNLDESDAETIKAHAEYLLMHPHYTLVVTGHTDNQGSKKFNQHLSEVRAQNVADMLMAYGVPAAQLRVGGMGDSVPMVSPKNWDENRRVEFVYQDSMIATYQ